MAVVTALAASPGAAATHTEGVSADDNVVSRATANAINLTAGGQIANSGAYVAVNDGALQSVSGLNVPKLPLVSDQKLVSLGALGQDSAATSNGYAAACAGIVGADGAVKLGTDNSCLVTGDGSMEISLGSLEQLGLGALLGGKLPGLDALPALPDVGGLTKTLPAVPDVAGLTNSLPAVGTLTSLAGGGSVSAPALPDVGSLPALPAVPALQVPSLPALQVPNLALPQLPALSLPTGGLPDIKLMVVGKSITADCLATPSATYGKASPVQAQVVASVAGQQIPLADIPPEGLSLSLTDVLAKVQGALPAEASGVLDQLLAAIPTDQLDAVRLANISVGEKTGKLGEVTVTGLGVETAYPGLLNMALGRVTCASGMFHGPVAAAPDAKSGDAKVLPVKPEVQAGAAAKATKDGSEGEGTVSADLSPASNNTPLAPFGWGAVIAIMLAGVGLAGFKLRRLIRH